MSSGKTDNKKNKPRSEPNDMIIVKNLVKYYPVFGHHQRR